MTKQALSNVGTKGGEFLRVKQSIGNCGTKGGEFVRGK
jgi:general stress protein YciG